MNIILNNLQFLSFWKINISATELDYPSPAYVICGHIFWKKDGKLEVVVNESVKYYQIQILLDKKLLYMIMDFFQDSKTWIVYRNKFYLPFI